MLSDYYINKLNAKERGALNDLLCGISKKKPKIALSSALTQRIIETVLYSYPELYFVDFADISSTSSVVGITARITYLDYDESAIKKHAETILAGIKKGSTETVVRQLHNYFVKNIKYDEENPKKTESHNIVGVLKDGKGVCEGIAKAFQYLLNRLNIDNAIVTGECDGEPHMWNVVNIEGRNYHIDVTTDISLSEPFWNKPGYFCYLLTDIEIKKTHSFKEHFECNSHKDNPFYKANRVFSDNKEIISYLKTLRRDESIIYFNYKGKMDADEVSKTVSLYWKKGWMTGGVFMKCFLNTYYYWI